MDFLAFSTSKRYFEISDYIDPPLVDSRSFFAKRLLQIALIFPLAIGLKFCKTLLRLLSVALSAGFVILTLGGAAGLRSLFLRRVASFAEDMADWVLYPLAIVSCLSRLALAILVHPSLFFRY